MVTVTYSCAGRPAIPPVPLTQRDAPRGSPKTFERPARCLNGLRRASRDSPVVNAHLRAKAVTMGGALVLSERE